MEIPPAPFGTLRRGEGHGLLLLLLPWGLFRQIVKLANNTVKSGRERKEEERERGGGGNRKSQNLKRNKVETNAHELVY